MAINGTLITVATLLAVFDIGQVHDVKGEPTLKEAKMTSGMLSQVFSTWLGLRLLNTRTDMTGIHTHSIVRLLRDRTRPLVW